MGRCRRGRLAGRIQPPAPLLAGLTSAFGLHRCGHSGLGPGVRARVALQRRMTVHAGLRANHAAEHRTRVGLAPDAGRRPAGVNGPIGNRGTSRGNRRGSSHKAPPAASAGDVAACAFLRCHPVHGIPVSGRIAASPAPASAPGPLPVAPAGMTGGCGGRSGGCWRPASARKARVRHELRPPRIVAFPAPGLGRSRPPARAGSRSVVPACRHRSGPLRLTR